MMDPDLDLDRIWILSVLWGQIRIRSKPDRISNTGYRYSKGVGIVNFKIKLVSR